MSAFDDARSVEARSLRMLRPFLEDLAGRYVLTDKGRLARFLQETCGDLLFNDDSGRLWGVELKAELAFTGNLFLETWSNRNLTDPQSHADRGSNPGWLTKVRADLLFYHFVDSDRLYILNLYSLKRWAFKNRSQRGLSERAGRIRPEHPAGRIYDFPEREQRKYDQPNDTWGRCVPVSVLIDEMAITPRLFSVEQLSLRLLEGAARPHLSDIR